MTRLRASEKTIYFIAVPTMIALTLALVTLLPSPGGARFTIGWLVIIGVLYCALDYWLHTRRGWSGLRYVSPLISSALITAAAITLNAQARAAYLLYFPAVIVHSIRYGRNVGLAMAALSAAGYYVLQQMTDTSLSPMADLAVVTLSLLLVALLSGTLADEAQYRLLVDSLTNYAVFMLDAQGRITSWNPGAQNLKGYKPEEIIGKHFSIFYPPPEIVRGTPDAILESAALNGHWEGEGWHVRKDGTQFWASVALTALRDAAGQVRGFAKVTRDLTERKQMEQALQDAKANLEQRVLERTAELEAANENLQFELAERQHTEELLRESEERYRTLVETSPDAIALTDLSGNIVMVNRQALKLFGYEEAEELIGQNTMDLIDQSDHLRAISHAVWVMEKGEVHNAEYRLRRKDQTTFAAELSSTLVVDAEQHRPTAIINLIRDISERKRVEEALRESEARFRVIFEQAAIGLSLRDLEGHTVETNPALQELLGYSAEELRERSFLDFLHPEDSAENQQLFAELIQGQRDQYQRVNRYVRKDGQLVWGRAKVALLRDSQGQPSFILGMIEDITEQQRAEDDLRKINVQLTEGLNKLEQRHHETTLLNQMSDLLQTCITTQEATSILAKHMPKLFPDEVGALFEFNPTQNLIEAITLWGERVIGDRIFLPDDCWALRRERVYVINDIASGFICPHLSSETGSFNTAADSLQGYLCVPMMAQGELLGLLHIQSSHHSPAIESRRELAETAAERIALALANIKLRETLRIQSIRDSLTGVFNRRYMEESLPRELRRAARNRRSLGIIMLDIDHFKQFNDTYGHDAGDAMLRELGNFLQSNVRAEDIVCRYGGEEFTLILPDASLEHSRQRAEQLRLAVKGLHVQHNDHAFGQITLSFGISVFPDHGTTAETLLRAADAALYRAKALGRDCVVAGGE